MAITRPEDFGVVDGINDTALITQAMTAAGDGGKVILEGRYSLPTGLGIPENVCLEGTFNPFGIHPWQTPTQVHSLGSTLIVDSDHSMFLSAGAQLHNLSVIRGRTTTAEPDTSQFAGVAIAALGESGNEIDGISLTNLQILGFYTAIVLDMCPRAIIEYVSGDNIQGIKLGTTYDVVRVKNIHFWPFHTTGAGMTGAAHNRDGVALWISQRIDIAQFEGFFSYGYHTGVQLDANVGTATFVDCHVDNTDFHSGAAGFRIIGSVAYSNFIGCSSYNNSEGYVCSGATTDDIYFIGCRSISNDESGWVVNSGSVHLSSCEIVDSNHGAVVAGGNGKLSISDTTFSGNRLSNILSIAGGRVTENHNTFNGSASSSGFGLTVVLLSDPLPLPPTESKFIIIGNGTFGTLLNGWAGREITLVFDGNITVVNGPSLHLSGNLTAAPGTALQLIHTGSYWAEVSRSLNQ